jgi:putative nucleotidyltransferase with HDIG domain
MIGQSSGALMRATTSVLDAMWLRDPATALHSMRVGRIAGDVAWELGLDARQVARTRVGGLLHDTGKLGVDRGVLKKPAALTEAERGVMNLHPEHGDDLLRRIGIPEDIRRIARGHHERLDGAGYPDRLAGDQIPIELRVVSAVDVYEAMRGTRPYRSPLDHAGAMAELERRAGWHLDPDVVAAVGRVAG